MDLIGDYATQDERSREHQQPIDPRDSRHQLLKRIYDQHCLFSLRFAQGGEVYQTAIIELEPAGGYLVLDAMVPEGGNQLAATRSAITLQTRLSGIDVKFATRITARGSQDGLPYFQVLYPATIEYPQRRREYRVAVPFDRGIEVRYFPPQGGCIRGEVRDLSPSGFCARLRSGDVDRLAATDTRQGPCEIDLGAGVTLRTGVAICHVLPGRARTAPRIGACFTDLDARSERLLERACAALDRERMRAH